MLAAGVSTSFVSCVDTDEPDSIVTLRNAKAEEVKAEAEYQRALAAVQNAEAELLIAKKSIEAANAKKAEYEAEYKNLENAHQKAVWAADEAERAIELANKEAASETQKQLAIAEAKLQLEQKNKALADAVNATKCAAAGYEAALKDAEVKATIAANKAQFNADKEVLENAYNQNSLALYGPTAETKKVVTDYLDANKDLQKALADFQTKLTILSGDESELQAKVDAATESLAKYEAGKEAFINKMKDADLTKWIDEYNEQKAIKEGDANAKNIAEKEKAIKTEEREQKYNRPLAKLKKTQSEAKAKKEAVDAKVAQAKTDFTGIGAKNAVVESATDAQKKYVKEFQLEISVNLANSLTGKLGDDFTITEKEGKYFIKANVGSWVNETFYYGKKDEWGVVTVKSPLENLKTKLTEFSKTGNDVVNFDELYFSLEDLRTTLSTQYNEDAIVWSKDGTKYTAKQAATLQSKWEQALKDFKDKTVTTKDNVTEKYRELVNASYAYFNIERAVAAVPNKITIPVSGNPSVSVKEIDYSGIEKSVTYGELVNDLKASVYAGFYEYLGSLLPAEAKLAQISYAQELINGKTAANKDAEYNKIEGNNIEAKIKVYADAKAKAESAADAAKYEVGYTYKYKDSESDQNEKSESKNNVKDVVAADALKAYNDATEAVNQFVEANKAYKEEADKYINERSVATTGEQLIATVIVNTIDNAELITKSIYDVKNSDVPKGKDGEITNTTVSFTMTTSGVAEYSQAYNDILSAYDYQIDEAKKAKKTAEENLATFKAAVAAGKDGSKLFTKLSDNIKEDNTFENLKADLKDVTDLLSGEKSLEKLQETYDQKKEAYDAQMALYTTSK